MVEFLLMRNEFTVYAMYKFSFAFQLGILFKRYENVTTTKALYFYCFEASRKRNNRQ